MPQPEPGWISAAVPKSEALHAIEELTAIERKKLKKQRKAQENLDISLIGTAGLVGYSAGHIACFAAASSSILRGHHIEKSLIRCAIAGGGIASLVGGVTMALVFSNAAKARTMWRNPMVPTNTDTKAPPVTSISPKM